MPVDIYELVDFNVNVENLVESDDIVTVQNVETDEYSAASLNDNFQELTKACPEWEQETKGIHPKWLEHHQFGHLTKDPGCPVCMEEAESKVNHRLRKGDRQPRIMHCDLAALEASADGHKYCLVAAVTIQFLPRKGHTFAKASQCKWEVYRDTFQKYQGQGSI